MFLVPRGPLSCDNTWRDIAMHGFQTVLDCAHGLRPVRRGHTLVELLAAIGSMALRASLILPLDPLRTREDFARAADRI